MRALLILAFSFGAQCASLNVVVQDMSTQVPIPNVELRLARSNAPMTLWTASTGADGTARFDNLTAGSYMLETKREGYLDSKLTSSSQTVVLKDGDPEREVRLQLMASTNIEGRVFDEGGRPMPGVLVRSWWVETTTGADGRYRLANVRAGRGGLSFYVPLEIRKKTLERDVGTGALLGYPPIEYYPGVADPASAVSISVAGGMDLRGYDVRLPRVPLADFTGTLLAGPDEPLTGAEVELQTPGSAPRSEDALGSRTVDADGRFSFDMIPPGT